MAPILTFKVLDTIIYRIEPRAYFDIRWQTVLIRASTPYNVGYVENQIVHGLPAIPTWIMTTSLCEKC